MENIFEKTTRVLELKNYSPNTQNIMDW